MIADSADVPVCRAACGPRSSRSALGCTKKLVVATARVHPTIVGAAAIVWVLKVRISPSGAVRIVGGVEGRWVAELHVYCSDGQQKLSQTRSVQCLRAATRAAKSKAPTRALKKCMFAYLTE